MRPGTGSGFFDKVTTDDWLAQRCDWCDRRATDVSIVDPKDGRFLCGEGLGCQKKKEPREDCPTCHGYGQTDHRCKLEKPT